MCRNPFEAARPGCGSVRRRRAVRKEWPTAVSADRERSRAAGGLRRVGIASESGDAGFQPASDVQRLALRHIPCRRKQFHLGQGLAVNGQGG